MYRNISKTPFLSWNNIHLVSEFLKRNNFNFPAFSNFCSIKNFFPSCEKFCLAMNRQPLDPPLSTNAETGLNVVLGLEARKRFHSKFSKNFHNLENCSKLLISYSIINQNLSFASIETFSDSLVIIPYLFCLACLSLISQIEFPLFSFFFAFEKLAECCEKLFNLHQHSSGAV